MSNQARIYVGHLSSRAREDDVERFFKGYGRIKEVNLKNGYGFVEFEDVRDAEDAVHDLNDKDLCGERVRIEHARGVPRTGGDYRDRPPPYRGGHGGGNYGNSRDRGSYFQSRAFEKYGPPKRTDYTILVENLSTRVSWQDLKDYLRQAGEVTYAEAHKSKRNEGIVDCLTYDDMKTIIDKLDDTEINGRRIRLSEGKPSRSNRRSHSRSRSRDRRRSRSRSRSRGKRGRYYDKRSRSRSDSRSRSRSKSKSRSRSRSEDKSPKRRHSSSRSRSGSGSPNGR